MPIVLEIFGIAYFYTPKCACTSVKQFLYQAEQGRPWDSAEHGGREVHYYWRTVRGVDNHRSITAAVYDTCAGVWKFGVVRDPLERLLSAYANRVEFHSDLRGIAAGKRLQAASEGLSLSPGINAFFHRLEAYRALGGSVAHHIRPQSDFLGPDLGRLDKVFRMEDMEALHRELVGRTGLDAPMPHEQTGGRKYTIADLDDRSLESIRAFLAPEYAYLSGLYAPPW